MNLASSIGKITHNQTHKLNSISISKIINFTYIHLIFSQREFNNFELPSKHHSINKSQRLIIPRGPPNHYKSISTIHKFLHKINLLKSTKQPTKTHIIDSNSSILKLYIVKTQSIEKPQNYQTRIQ
jgi:hypothetical protein